jgi:diguanylate cyclase (GGDEF)-like protein
MDAVTILTRRLARERLARKAAEEIAENKSRELFLRGQELAQALDAETTARAETQALLRALESFTSTRAREEILEYLRGFITEAVPCAVMTLSDTPAPDATMTLPVEAPLFGATNIVIHRTKSTPPPPGAPALIRALVQEAGLALDNARLFDKVEQLSLTDPLTGLYNRRYLDLEGARLVALAGRHGKLLALQMIDLDHFKAVNDTHGHAVGDAVLREASETLRTVTRRTDLAARFGGEELCVLLPETDIAGAEVLARRFLDSLRACPFTGQGGAAFHVTASVGVAALGSAEETLEDLIERADTALYRAKDEGRDRVVSESSAI